MRRPQPRPRWARVAQGGIVATIAVFVAALSHLVAGGETPGLLGGAVALVFGIFGSTLLSLRRLPLVGLIASVGFSQLVFHLLFSVGAVDGRPVPVHSHLAPVLDAPLPAGHHDGRMWLAHAFAGVVAVALLKLGDRLAGALAALASPWTVAARLAAPLAIPALPRILGEHPLPRPALRLFLTALRRRGPPLPMI